MKRFRLEQINSQHPETFSTPQFKQADKSSLSCVTGVFLRFELSKRKAPVTGGKVPAGDIQFMLMDVDNIEQKQVTVLPPGKVPHNGDENEHTTPLSSDEPIDIMPIAKPDHGDDDDINNAISSLDTFDTPDTNKQNNDVGTIFQNQPSSNTQTDVCTDTLFDWSHTKNTPMGDMPRSIYLKYGVTSSVGVDGKKINSLQRINPPLKLSDGSTLWCSVWDPAPKRWPEFSLINVTNLRFVPSTKNNRLFVNIDSVQLKTEGQLNTLPLSARMHFLFPTTKRLFHVLDQPSAKVPDVDINDRRVSLRQCTLISINNAIVDDPEDIDPDEIPPVHGSVAKIDWPDSSSSFIYDDKLHNKKESSLSANIHIQQWETLKNGPDPFIRSDDDNTVVGLNQNHIKKYLLQTKLYSNHFKGLGISEPEELADFLTNNPVPFYALITPSIDRITKENLTLTLTINTPAGKAGRQDHYRDGVIKGTALQTGWRLLDYLRQKAVRVTLDFVKTKLERNKKYTALLNSNTRRVNFLNDNPNEGIIMVNEYTKDLSTKALYEFYAVICCAIDDAEHQELVNSVVSKRHSPDEGVAMLKQLGVINLLYYAVDPTVAAKVHEARLRAMQQQRQKQNVASSMLKSSSSKSDKTPKENLTCAEGLREKEEGIREDQVFSENPSSQNIDTNRLDQNFVPHDDTGVVHTNKRRKRTSKKRY